METTKTFESYPLRIVVLSNLSSFTIYFFGLFITYRLAWFVSAIYLIYILSLEYRLLSRHCVNCYYWGKTCGFGRGVLSSLLFKKGYSSEFCNKEMTWKAMIPDLLISLIPLVTGIVLLIIKFDFLLLFAMVIIIALTTTGNGYIRGSLTCNFCRQRELGCPAHQLFNKESGISNDQKA